MPVHRHQHDKLGSVYAFPSELDAWAQSRRGPAPESPPDNIARPAGRRWMLWLTAAVVVVAVVLAAVFWTSRKPDQNPLADARFVRLTDFEGTEQAAAIS